MSKKKFDEIFEEREAARLFPDAGTKQEANLVSILLAALPRTPVFTGKWLKQLGDKPQRLWSTRNRKLDCYTGVQFPITGKRGPIADGVLRITTSRSQWTALLEAKVKVGAINNEIKKQQLNNYVKVAKKYKDVNAVITLSNQLASLPHHPPYEIPTRPEAPSGLFFHFSWINIRTLVELVREELKKKKIDSEERFLLEELAKYMDHKESGVWRYKRMDGKWRQLVDKINNDTSKPRNLPMGDVENAAASWFQEERDICLLLSRLTSEQVSCELRPKNDPEHRTKIACDNLAKRRELCSSFRIPDATSNLAVTANLKDKSISCSMKIKAPCDDEKHKGAKAQLNWLTNQLKKRDDKKIKIRDDIICVRLIPTKGSIEHDVISLKDALEMSGRTPYPPLKEFEISAISKPRNFNDPEKFITQLEQLIEGFYRRVGEHLRNWIPPAPTMKAKDPIEAHREAQQ